MIDRAKRIIKGAVKRIQKKAGLHIFRKVGNAQKWADWLVASGVPNPKSADELIVTVMTAMGEVQVIPQQNAYVIPSTSGVFCVIGGKLCFAWYDYGYYDRHWALRELTNCEVCHHSRAVLILSDEPGDFDFSDEALLAAPASLVLDGESTAAINDDQVEITKSAGAGLFTPSTAQAEKAKSLLMASFDDGEADPMQQAALDDMSRGLPLKKSAILEDLGADMAQEVGLADGTPAPKPVVDAKPVITVQKSSKDLTKPKLKSDNERRIIYGWASVSQNDGEVVKDYAGDEITEDALHDLCHLIVKGQNQGAFEHDPDTVGDSQIVEAFVFDKPMQDALGIDLGRTGVLIGMHIPEDADWAEANDGDWEFSINATAVIEVTEEQKEAA